MSVRLKLTLSYAGLLTLAGALVLAAGWVFVLRYVPDSAIPTASGLMPTRLIFRGDTLTVVRLLVGAYAPVAAIALSFLLVFGLLSGWVLAGRMLAPLTRITDATRKAAGGSLSHRIALDGPGDEFRELADSFDAMLARLEAHVGEQQRFAANASHELRTPLATTQTLLEVARQDPNRNQDELVDRLHAVNSRAIDLTEALLVLSRAGQRSFAREPVDLSLIAEDATETLLALAEGRGLTIETAGEPTPAVGSPALLRQLVTNLVHNAIMHNRRDHGTVWVTTSRQPGGAVLTVENTGDNLAPDLVPTLIEPFQRGADRVRSGHAGVGLGLAIVHRIAQAHDGTLTLSPRAAGGLCVTVRLPAAPVALAPGR